MPICGRRRQNGTNKAVLRFFHACFFFFDYDKILSEYYFSSNDFGKT